jgi:GntR family transcriptional regulator
LKIIITNTSGIPIYEQIKEQIKATILSDEICEGEMLPSIRQLAKDLKISVITTTRAYTDLEQEGYIINVQGKGCYVAPKDSDLIHEQLLHKIEDGFNAAINAARIAKLPREELQKLFEFTLEENQYEQCFGGTKSP